MGHAATCAFKRGNLAYFPGYNLFTMRVNVECGEIIMPGLGGDSTL